MIKKILYIFLLMSSQMIQAQENKKGSTLDFGLYLGGSNYWGDLTKDYQPLWNKTKLAGGLIARYNVGPYLTFRGTALYGRIEGADKYLDSDPARKRRNLSFKSDIVEFSIGAEWNIIGYENTRNTFGWSPYLFGSVAVFRFNPKAQFKYNAALHDASLQSQDGDWIELQPLGTEGQETTTFNDKRRYALTQISIPLGVGSKWQLNDHWALGIDFGVRKTFTDYIDDVSTVYVDDAIVGGANGAMSVALKDRSMEVGQIKYENNESRGNAKNKDWYLMGGITLTYRILGGKQPCFNF